MSDPYLAKFLLFPEEGKEAVRQHFLREEWLRRETASLWYSQLGEMREKALNRYIELNRRNVEFWEQAMFQDVALHEIVNNNVNQSYFDVLFIDDWEELE